MKQKNKLPWSVLVSCSFLISASFYKLLGFSDYSYYQFMFQQLPENVIPWRYGMSVSLRCVNLAVVFGLVTTRRKFFRMAIVWLATVNLLFLYWKHPFDVFRNIAVYAEMGFPEPMPIVTGREVLNFPMFPYISQMFYVFLDWILSVALIYVFTRPKIKEIYIK